LKKRGRRRFGGALAGGGRNPESTGKSGGPEGVKGNKAGPFKEVPVNHMGKASKQPTEREPIQGQAAVGGGKLGVLQGATRRGEGKGKRTISASKKQHRNLVRGGRTRKAGIPLAPENLSKKKKAPTSERALGVK